MVFIALVGFGVCLYNGLDEHNGDIGQQSYHKLYFRGQQIQSYLHHIDYQLITYIIYQKKSKINEIIVIFGD